MVVERAGMHAYRGVCSAGWLCALHPLLQGPHRRHVARLPPCVEEDEDVVGADAEADEDG